MTSLNPLSAARAAVQTAVHSWSVDSQQGARRNAMVASTALAARRAEREDVRDFFSSLERGEEERRRALGAGL